MPPKTKTKKAAKGKASAAVDGLSTDEMSKDQLEEHIVRLREELDREREERSYFQLERDKIQASWEISRRNMEETKAKLRERQREKEEAEERHRVEISVMKQKLKHVLSEHHDSITGLKMDAVASKALIQDQHLESELGLRRDVHGLQADFRQNNQKLLNEERIHELQLKQQVELMQLTNDYDARGREMEVKYHKKMQSMRDLEEKRRLAEVRELEDTMRSRVATLIEDQDRALRGADEYFTDVRNKLLADQKKLKERLAEAVKLEARATRELSAATKENKRLRASLQEAQQKLPELQKQLQEHEKAKAKMVASDARVKVLEKELREMSVLHELLRQATVKLQQERDDLLRRKTEAIQDVEHRSGLKELLVERKLAVLTVAVERTEAQLCAALAASNGDQSAAAANRLEEKLESKQATIDALQRDSAAGSEEYDALLQTCQDKLKALGVPLYIFPHRPSKEILGGRTRKQHSCKH